MSQLSALHNIKNKSGIGSGVAGISLGTIVIALAPKITGDATIIETLQLMSPSVSVVGAFLTKTLISYVRTYYLVWAASKIEQKIDGFLKNPELSPEHIQNLKTKREELQLTQINAMENGLINEEVTARGVVNKSRKKSVKGN